MEIILEFVSSKPAYIGENLKIIQKNKNPLLELINKANNGILNQILLNIFETRINIYFDSIPNITNILIIKIIIIKLTLLLLYQMKV